MKRKIVKKNSSHSNGWNQKFQNMASVHSVMVYVPAFTFPAHILKYGLGALLHIMLHFTLFTPLNIHVVFESCKVFFYFQNFTSKKEQLILLQKNAFVCSDYAMLFFIIGCWGKTNQIIY